MKEREGGKIEEGKERKKGKRKQEGGTISAEKSEKKRR